jgi:integrase
MRRIEDRGAVETAHRLLATCGQIFRYGIVTGRAERDPSRDLKGALRPFRTKHFPAATEPAEVAEILRAIYGYKGTLTVACALKLAPHVFVRPGELRRARWEDIDLEQAVWKFNAQKTHMPHIVPLSTQAIEILKEIHPLTSTGEYVFPSARAPRGDRPMSDNAILSALRRLGIEKEEMTGHGWRAVARTLLDEALGFRVAIIELQLAHTVRDIHGRAYNRTQHLEERHSMMQAWSDYLSTLKRDE